MLKMFTSSICFMFRATEKNILTVNTHLLTFPPLCKLSFNLNIFPSEFSRAVPIVC